MFHPLGKMYLIRSAFEQYVYINIFLLCSFEGNLFDKDKKKKGTWIDKHHIDYW
jgi:hypothetical protein